MTSERDWDSINFNPKRDRHWANAKKIKEKDRQDCLATLITAGIIIIGLSVLILVSLFFI